MAGKFSQQDQELYQYLDEVLFYKWDPLSVSDTPEARGEYHSYAGVVLSMLKQKKSEDEICEYLCQIENKQMGLTVSEKSRAALKEIVKILLNYKDFIEEKYSEK